jgi:hypothetical protein
MPAGIRANTHRLAIEAETAFGIENAVPAPIEMMAWDITGPPQRAILEDQSTRQSLGENPPTLGLPSEAGELSFKTYAMGIGSVAGDAVAPAKNQVTDCLSAVCGSASVGTQNTPALAASTSTKVLIAAAAGYADGGFYAVPFQVAGSSKAHVRPCTYASADDSLNLLIALPGAPDPGPPTADRVWGCRHVQMSQNPTFSLQGNIIGGHPNDSWSFLGVGGGNLTIEAASPSEAQTLSFDYMVADFESPDGSAQTSPEHIHAFLPSAGGSFLMAHESSTVPFALDYLKVGIETGREYVKNPAANHQSGLQGYYLTDQITRVNLVVRINDPVPTGSTGTTWREIFENQELFNFVFSWGRVPGKIFSIAARNFVLMEDPAPSEEDGIATFGLVFGASNRAAYPHITFSQA